MAAYLALEDGEVIEGRGRSPGESRGELVFTTAYTGYEESLTDPSYEEQVLTFSYPLIGNYGVRSERFESERIHPKAVLARELTDDIVEWLTDEAVPAIDHIDTREIVTKVRDEGAMRCGLSVGEGASPDAAITQLEDCLGMSQHTDIGAQVSVDARHTYGESNDGPTIALIDCGVKGSIISSLVDRGAVVDVYPYDTPIDVIRSKNPDLIFISNGPGDPANYTEAIELIEATVEEKPIAGICLGQQIVARALDGSTEKMRFGHRGVNQPVIDADSGKVVMTTQNHGYTVDNPGPHLEVAQRNVNDDTPEGLVGREYDVLTRQYHPEANPGPHDTLGFFDDVIDLAT